MLSWKAGRQILLLAPEWRRRHCSFCTIDCLALLTKQIHIDDFFNIFYFCPLSLTVSKVKSAFKGPRPGLSRVQISSLEKIVMDGSC